MPKQDLNHMNRELIQSSKDLEKVLDKSLRNVMQLEARSLRRGTATWDNKPVFNVIRTDTTPNTLSYMVFTDSEIWGYVNWGVPRHWIYPKPSNEYGLVFRGQFTPKTTVGKVGSKQGGKYGGKVRIPSPQGVDHPGIEPRRFDLLNADKRSARIEAEITKVIDKLLG